MYPRSSLQVYFFLHIPVIKFYISKAFSWYFSWWLVKWSIWKNQFKPSNKNQKLFWSLTQLFKSPYVSQEYEFNQYRQGKHLTTGKIIDYKVSENFHACLTCHKSCLLKQVAIRQRGIPLLPRGRERGRALLPSWQQQCWINYRITASPPKTQGDKESRWPEIWDRPALQEGERQHSHHGSGENMSWKVYSGHRPHGP